LYFAALQGGVDGGCDENAKLCADVRAVEESSEGANFRFLDPCPDFQFILEVA
jgi:hypothetical protein